MTPSTTDHHTPVLAGAFVRLCCHDPDGRYIDATFGRGGHSRRLLAAMSPRGRLLALDRDPEAVRAGQALMREDERFHIAHAEFAHLEDVAEDLGWRRVQGIGFDLGVSSPQLDQAERGFSFLREGPLDMRMDPTRGLPLPARLRRVSTGELTRILREYGNERFAGRIARRILEAVRADTLHTTADLENLCFHAVPAKFRHGSTHPATRTFQALRIWVNDEFAQIDAGIQAAMRLLAPGGRLVVIAFHSGEDRRVRDLIEQEVRGCLCPPKQPLCTCGRRPSMRWLQKKPLRASEEERARNPRSRSALLRAAERLGEAR